MNGEQTVRAAEERVQHVMTHISRVLAKFPAETIPKDLHWALGHTQDVFFRVTGTHVVLHITRFGSPLRTQFPAALLSAPEQDIHAWARGTYWAGRRSLRDEEARERTRRVGLLHETIANAERKLADLGVTR